LVDLRIYRAALIPVVVALVTVMFSIQDRPAPMTSALAPDAFDSKGAWATVNELLRRAPERRAGSAGDQATADVVEGRLQSLPGFETARDEFSAELDGKKVSMVNVTGTVSGPSARQVVIMAHRDAAGRPGASSAADTAVLLELAKVLAGVRHEKTIVFVSTDGAQADNAGARRFAETYPDRGKVDATIVLGDVAAAAARRPFIVPWSSDSTRAPLALVRTAEVAIQREIGTDSGSESVPGQFMRLAWPLTLREQGPLLRHDLDALTLTAGGEMPRGTGPDGIDGTSRVRLMHFGKVALATALAIDSSEPESSPPSYLASGRKLIPGWGLSLLAFSLLAPVGAAALDGFARARRRGRPIGRWIRWVLAAGVPILVVFAGAWLFELLDWLPATASEALSPASRPSFSEAAPALAALALLFAIAWLLVRPAAADFARPADDDQAVEAALAVSLVLSVELLLLWFVNPFATLLLIPSAHLCLLFALPGAPGRGALAPVTAAAVLLLPALALLYYGAQFDLGLDLSRYALLLVTGGGSLWNVALVSAISGTLLSLVMIALTRRETSVAEITVRGPTSYAGPGSLGGTQSALRRG
jgi:hypothetical protein